MNGRSVALAALLLIAAACSGAAPSDPPVSTSQPSSGASPVSTSGPLPTVAGFLMCELMPEGDVLPLAPFTIAYRETEPWDAVPQGCRYSWAGDQQFAHVSLVVTDFVNAHEAMTSHQNQFSRAEDLGLAIERLSGPGESASLLHATTHSALQFLVGNRVVDVSVGGQDLEIDASRWDSTARALADILFQRLP